MIRRLGNLLHRLYRARNSGAAAVELAITAPFMVVLALGAADYGALMVASASLEGATRAVAEYARNSPECAAGGLANSNCYTTGINNLVSTLKTANTSLSSATFTVPGAVSGVSANYCTCTDGSVPTGAGITNGCPSTATNPCAAKTDPRLLQYIRIRATQDISPLVPYGTFTSAQSLTAQTTTRIQ